MGDTTSRYVPFDYRRICDVCGELRNRSQLVERPGLLFVCSYHPYERTELELSEAIAATRPIVIKPVPDPKPLDPANPNVFEADEANIFNFIDQQITNAVRYENVTYGDGAPRSGEMLNTMGWAGRYLYNLINQNQRPPRFINRATSLLSTVAAAIYARQHGFGLVPVAARATDAYWGGVLELGATTYVTTTNAVCGLALLYAYRVSGTPRYLAAARGIANYLRNVQAIGKCAYQYTSSDAAHNVPFYTGGLVSEVSTLAGVDPGEGFYSSHLFYPSSLIALEFWNALKTTDGDQTIGATSTGDAFLIVPSQLLSQSIDDLRDCWETGIRNVNGETYTGLSATTPREFFNAFPATKPYFTITGTGKWEFQDGDADTGTAITGQNFATALSSLYSYEGASEQVTTVSDWLRTFTSNPEFETPANTSDMELARSTTGTYDPTVTLSTLLTVRDADNAYAAIKTNGSSLYDWGAFGLLAPIWATRNKSTFTTSRVLPLGENQRFRDGKRADGDMFDYITIRGESGLSLQTAFMLNMLASDPATTPYAQGSTNGTTLPGVGAGLVLWLRGPESWIVSGGLITGARDLSGYDQHFTSDSTFEMYAGLDTINGIPCASGGFNEGKYLIRTSALRNRSGVAIGYGPGQSQPRTIMAVLKPQTGVFSITGGPVFAMAGDVGPIFQCMFDLESGTVSNGFYAWSRTWRDLSPATAVMAPATSGSVYNNVPVLAEWRSSGFPDINFAVNGTNKTLTPPDMYGSIGGTHGNFAIFGNYDTLGFGLNFYKATAELVVWDYELSADELTQARQYFGNRYSSLGLTGASLAMVNDAVRAAQFGNAFRYNPRAVQAQ